MAANRRKRIGARIPDSRLRARRELASALLASGLLTMRSARTLEDAWDHRGERAGAMSDPARHKSGTASDPARPLLQCGAGKQPLGSDHSAVALGLKPCRRRILCGEAVVVCGADASGLATWLRIERKLRLVRRRANQQLVRTNTPGGVRRSAQGNSFDL